MFWADKQSDQPIVLSVMSVPAVRSLAEIRSEDELSQLFPEAMFPVCPEGGDSLEGSMELLKKGLESGTVLIQFEVRGSQGLNLHPVTATHHVPLLQLSSKLEHGPVSLAKMTLVHRPQTRESQ